MADNANVGYASLQVIPVVKNIGGNVVNQIGQPFIRAGQQAGQQAGAAIATGVEQAALRVQKASGKVAAAREAEIAANAKVRIEEAKLQELRDKGITGGSRWLRAEENRRKAQAQAVSATDRARRAAEELADAEREAADATDEVTDAANDGGSSLDGLGGKLKDLVGNFEVAALGAAGLGAALTAGIVTGMENDQINDKLAASLGASPALAEEYGKTAGDLYRRGMGESMAEISEAVGVVTSSFRTLGSEGEVSLDKATERAVNFANTFGTDVQESVTAVSTLMSTGLVKDTTQGFDLMTTAFQRVPAAMRDELPEILQEYGVNFSALGFSGEQAFNVLVQAADKGKFALDKTGDALKEFSIRGSDMSKASSEAYQAIGLDAGEMSNKVAKGGAGAQEALQKTAAGLLKIESPAERANAAIALFGTPLEDLSVDQIPAFLEGLAGGENSMAGFAGAADRMGQTLNDNGLAKIEAFKRSLQGGLQDALGATANWISQNVPLLKDLGIAAGAAAAGLAALAIQQKVVAAGGVLNFFKAMVGAAKAWAAQQAILNLVMSANPIVLVIAAVVALVAAIVIAYRNSETFRGIVAKLWDGIKAGASAVWSFIKPVFDGFVTAFKAIGAAAVWLWQNVLTPVFNGIKFVFALWWAGVQIYFKLLQLAWKGIEIAALWLWHNVITPVFDGIKFVFQLWWAGVQIYWKLIQIAWRAVAAVAMWLWHNIIEPAFNGISTVIGAVWNNVIKPAFDAFTAALGWVGDKAMWLWNEVMVPAWEGIKAAISAVWDFLKPIFSKIGDAINAVGEIGKKVGETLKSAFDGVVGVLKTPMHALGKILASVPTSVLGVDIPGASTIRDWGNTLQSLRTGGVVNNGLAGRTREGRLWGPGNGTSDSILGVDRNGVPTALVSNREGVVTEAAMDGGGASLVAALNSGWRPSADTLATLGIRAYATGGQVGLEPYGLPNGTAISYGGTGFPEWVQAIGREHNVKPSTYAGHQESDRGEAGYAPNPDRLNRGIDWSGSVEDMHKFAQWLLGVAPKSEGLEQIIWQNPQTGEKIGWAGRSADKSGSYFASDYSGHQDHVHTRQATLFPTPDAAPTTGDLEPGSTTATVPDTETTTTGTPATDTASKRRMKSFKELGSDLGGILAEGIGETFGLPDWIMDPQGYVDSNSDDGSNVRTSDDKGTTGTTTPPSTTPASPTTPGTPATPDPATALKGMDLYSYQIAKAAKDLGLGKDGAVIGNGTALVEVGDPMKMYANKSVPDSLNYPHDAVGSNHDSVGLFQQRDNGAWGTVADRMDPYKSAVMFFKALQGVNGWQTMDKGAAAQAVQRSAFPDKYAGRMPRAEELVAKTKLFDTGGVWEPGTFGYNGLGEPELVIKRHQWGVMDRNAAVVEQIARRGVGGDKLADTVNIQGYTAEEIADEWRRYQWGRTAGYGTSRNR